MRKSLFVIAILFACTSLIACKKDDSTKRITTGTIKERLNKLQRVESFKTIASNERFPLVAKIQFKQYIDHDNPKLGTFSQTIELGFHGFDATNVLVTNGYMNYDNYSGYAGENELAFLLDGNYLTVEHRYFGNSLPVEIDYNNTDTWKYLTTEQAAADYHDIVKEFKRILDGKWISTGGSKSGMTTEMFALYHPGDVDLYVPYVAPFCNSFADKRMIKFLNEETGDLQYGEARAKAIRDEVLAFQVKLLEYRDVLAPKFYQEGIASGAKYSTSATQDLLYDAAVIEFGIGFWQYYQPTTDVENCLAMSESSSKQSACYKVLTSVIEPNEMGIDNDFTPYYVQAYQELGNYGYDFHYIREALTGDAHLVVTEEQEATLNWDLVLNDSEKTLPQKELMYTKINNMLATTDQQFVIIYGSSDPWYSVRPDDISGRDNISTYVNTRHPHTSTISNFDKLTKNEILNKIKTILA